MPWKEIGKMDARIEFVCQALSKRSSMVELCREFGISTKTGYKWINRFGENGLDGLNELSKAPKANPNWCRDDFLDVVVSYRLQFPTWGARKLRAYMLREGVACPSQATIGRILRDKNLTRPARKSFFKRGPSRLTDSARSNHIWTADFKGHFKSNCGTYNYPLTIADHHSRYLIDVSGLTKTSLNETKEVFKRSFREYGLPEIIRTDNGVPFAGANGPSHLSIWWMELGITPELTDKGVPQQNGRHERMHRALREEAIDVKKYNFKQQNNAFRSYIEFYNHKRPHQSLQDKTPAESYTKSPRKYKEKIEAYEYPKYCEVRKTCSKGRIQLAGHRYFISHSLAKKNLGLIQIGEDIWEINFRGHEMGVINTYYNTFRGRYLFN